MAQCKNCGRKGIFLKLQNGLCNECVSSAYRKREILRLEQEHQSASDALQSLLAELHDQEALYSRIAQQAEEEGIVRALTKSQAAIDALEEQRCRLEEAVQAAQTDYAVAKANEEQAVKNAASAIRKVEKFRPLLKAIEHAIETYEGRDISEAESLATFAAEVEEFVSPTVTLDLQCLGMKDLRKRYRQNEKQIEEVLRKYEGRYTTKANAAIYKLMVIALKAELQNVLYSINYGKLDDALASVAAITAKYYTIATDGNQSIAPTLKKFIGEIEYLFQEAVRIEYEYYVQKERAKEEQRAIREQMRQEAEERRALEAERKKIEKEESKFQGQIAQLEEQLSSAEPDKVAQLEARLAELQAQLSAVKDKKDVITTLQNGKAGNVYVISNLGSFGEDVFKIGMTRRADPQDRIDELGDASVPFPFDVHSFIFSDDAAALEYKIHTILNNRRVNKVNLRKEFFHISLDELEELVASLAPTAEFRRTMLAEQYRQSLSIDRVVIAQDDSEEDE